MIIMQSTNNSRKDWYSTGIIDILLVIFSASEILLSISSAAFFSPGEAAGSSRIARILSVLFTFPIHGFFKFLDGFEGGFSKSVRRTG